MGTRLEEKKKTFKLIVALLSAAATLIWVLFFAWMLCQNSTSSEILELAEGWQVSVNGQALAQEDTLAAGVPTGCRRPAGTIAGGGHPGGVHAGEIGAPLLWSLRRAGGAAHEAG